MVARRLLAEGGRRLVLDLRKVTYMDSTCLGELIEASCLARQQGAELRLINVPPRIQRLLDISGLNAMLGTSAVGA